MSVHKLNGRDIERNIVPPADRAQFPRLFQNFRRCGGIIVRRAGLQIAHQDAAIVHPTQNNADFFLPAQVQKVQRGLLKQGVAPG